MKPILRKTAMSIVLGLSLAGTALAHSGASGVVKERMEAMKSIAAAMKAISVMIRGKAEFSTISVSEAATTIRKHAAAMPDLFPEGSDHKPSEVLPQIWTEWEEFRALALELENRASQLSQQAETARSAKEITPHFAELSRTCTACHEEFRQAN